MVFLPLPWKEDYFLGINRGTSRLCFVHALREEAPEDRHDVETEYFRPVANPTIALDAIRDMIGGTARSASVAQAGTP